jgi:hypothetical protein
VKFVGDAVAAVQDGRAQSRDSHQKFPLRTKVSERIAANSTLEWNTAF